MQVSYQCDRLPTEVSEDGLSIECNSAVVSGTLEAETVAAAWREVKALLVTPGEWDVTLSWPGRRTTESITCRIVV